MNAKATTLSLFSITCILAGAASDNTKAVDFAPERVKSIEIMLKANEATYKDDLGEYPLKISQAMLRTGPFSYRKPEANVSEFSFKDWNKVGGQVYSGSYTLTFEKKTTGTWREDYTGSYNGFVSGTFEIKKLDLPIKPVARARTVKTEKNKTATIRLRGTGKDIGTKLKYIVIGKPKAGRRVAGRLNTSKLPKVVFYPKAGFTGIAKFRYQVKEGKTKSLPKTVTIKVTR